MGRKNNKVRQLDGLGLDFDDMFGGGVSKPSKPPTKPQSVKPTERKENSTKTKEVSTKKAETLTEKPESTTRDLEQWLKQDEDFKRLQTEIETMKSAHQAERETWLQTQKDLEVQFATEKESLQAQSAPLHEEIKRLQTELLEAKQQAAAEQEELRVLKDEAGAFERYDGA